MLLEKKLGAFLRQRPFCVLTRAAFQRMLSPERLDQIFHDHATKQYERKLLFSSLVEVMGLVVTRIEPSVLAAYRSLKDKLLVSDEAVYQKLRNVELPVGEAMVRDSFATGSDVLKELKVEDRSWIPGKRVKVIDGNYLQASERRLAELRTSWDAPLPGRSLVVWDQQTRLVENTFLTVHGLASERSLLGDVLKTVRKGDVWVADRNFCTLGFLFGIAERKGKYIIRQHSQCEGELLGKRRRVGTTAKGEPVFEQELRITYQRKQRIVRRITVLLNEPTRDGDTELHILTNLTHKEAKAVKVAKVYSGRWSIEGVFLDMQMSLGCEVKTLSHPRAALFAFCVALLLQNTITMSMGTLRKVHGTKTIDEGVSRVLLSQELQKSYDGMMVQVPDEHWDELSTTSLKKYVAMLKLIAEYVDPQKYPKTKRGPKKPVTRKRRSRGGNVSTAVAIGLYTPSG